MTRHQDPRGEREPLCPACYALRYVRRPLVFNVQTGMFDCEACGASTNFAPADLEEVAENIRAGLDGTLDEEKERARERYKLGSRRGPTNLGPVGTIKEGGGSKSSRKRKKDKKGDRRRRGQGFTLS